LPVYHTPNRIFAVQPDKLKNLDHLLAQAEHYTNYSMRSIGRLPPTLFLIGLDGALMFMPDSLTDESAKDDFATNARLMCIAHAAMSVVMALEAWVMLKVKRRQSRHIRCNPAPTSHQGAEAAST